jgi:general secretion pathway protein D
LPMITKDDASIPDDEWVTRVIHLNAFEAVQAVPILRALLPQQAHLAAIESQNTLIIVDRYANVRRLTEILQTLDKAATPKSR